MPAWLVSLFDKVAFSAASAILAFIAGRFWKGLLRPWISDFWYPGPYLANNYKGEFTLKEKQCSDLIELRQKASKVWGTMTFPDGGHGRYKFEAVILDNVLRGTYDGVRHGPSARGVFLLAIDPRRNDLEGWFVEPHQGEVISVAYKWMPTRD
ncbi:MAG: hypothetical protein ABSD63_10190 [Candidatus Korobacteraceae bacterium]|jgi:hypothetical protein